MTGPNQKSHTSPHLPHNPCRHWCNKNHYIAEKFQISISLDPLHPQTHKLMCRKSIGALGEPMHNLSQPQLESHRHNKWKLVHSVTTQCQPPPCKSTTLCTPGSPTRCHTNLHWHQTQGMLLSSQVEQRCSPLL